MDDQKDFRFSYPVEVRFGDTDAMGHVNNARYFTYMESARIAYMEQVAQWERGSQSPGMILAHVECDFKVALVYGDRARVCLRVTRLGNASFHMAYVIVRENDRAIAATGTSVQVTYDYRTARSRPIPNQWRVNITRYEPGLNE